MTPLWIIAVCAVLFTARMIFTEFVGWVGTHYRYRSADIPSWIRRPLSWLT